MLKDITLATLLFLFVLFFYWRHYSKYYLEYVIPLKVKSSLVPFSNDPIDLALTLKEKPRRQHIKQSVFIEFSWSITKIRVIYIDGVRSYKNLASGENRGVWNTQMRHLMSFNMRICVKRHHIRNSAFLFVSFFYWRYYSKYYLEYVISPCKSNHH